MKILLCGSETPLGQALLFRLEQQPFPLLVADTADLLRQGAGELSIYLRERNIDALVNVLHLPFNSSAKDLESHYVQVPEKLAQAVASTGAFLLQLSDCQIFSGAQNRAYREHDEPDTQTAYGAMRWAGERAVVDYCEKHIILRTGEMFSSLGNNVLTQLVSSWRLGQSVPVSSRYQFCPTSVRDVARVTEALLKQLSCGITRWGIYHYCSTDVVGYRDFARLVRQILEAETDWHFDMPMHELQENAQPLSWALDCVRIRDTFGIKQHAWRAGLTSAVRRAMVTTQQSHGGEDNGNGD